MVPITPLHETIPVFTGQTVGASLQQQLPFTEGQQLQAQVRAQVDAGQYLLQINGEEIIASSNTPVQVGQQLKLEVASLTPHITLQVLTQTSPSSTLTSALPLLNLQPEFFSDIGQLSAGAIPADQLSTAARNTLSLFAAEATRSWPEMPPSQGGEELSSGATPLATLRQGLLQLSRTQGVPPQTAELAENLATALETVATNQNASQLLPTAGAGPTLQNQAQELLTSLGQWAIGQSAGNDWLNLLGQNVASWTDSSADPLVRLLSLMAATLPPPEQQESSPEVQPRDKSLPQLETLLNRLGLSFERQLAEGHIEEAKQTLKYALLEAAHQSSASPAESSLALRLNQTLELYQLLQGRLAETSLAFMPLPFPFLQQGFVLIDQDSQGQQQQKPSSGGNGRTLSLHVQLEGMGNMHINIDWQADNRLRLSFYTEAKEQAQYLAGFRDELSQWLTTADLESVQFLVGTQNPMQALLKNLTAEGMSMVDTRA